MSGAHENGSGGEAVIPPEDVNRTWGALLRAHGFGDLFDLGTDLGAAHPFDQRQWKPTSSDRDAAWELFTELRLQISTQPLPFRAGDEGAALESIYQLFTLARGMIRSRRDATHFATLVVTLLNRRVRPFTAMWHRRKLDGQLDNTDVRFRFRRELSALQLYLRRFTELLGWLAEGEGFVSGEGLDPVHVATATRSQARFAALPFGVGPGTPGLPNFAAINEAERAEVTRRRQFYGLESAEVPLQDAVGMALSGGGIRSATFALGIIGVLARRGIMRQVDFMSTVSGGGYIGAFLTSVLGETGADDVTLEPGPNARPFGLRGESGPVRHLRNHGKYLGEGGWWNRATIAALAVYGVCISLLLVVPWLLLAVLGLEGLRPQVFNSPPTSFSPGPLSLGALALLGVAVMLLPVVQNVALNLGKAPGALRFSRGWEWFCIALTTVSAAALGIDALPPIFAWVREYVGTGQALTVVATLPFVLGVVGVLAGTGRPVGRALLRALVLCGPLLALTAFFFLWDHVALLQLRTGTMVIVTLAALLYLGVGVNVNFASPHRFYRSRLARTYLTRSGAGENSVLACDPQLLSTLNPAAKAPYHLLNAALNIPASANPNLRGRNTDFFLFSKHFCGSPLVGYRPTSEWEALDRHLDLGTAVAISGAAAAPRMGTLTDSRLSGLLALLNVRLGYWLRVPGRGWLPARLQPWVPPLGWLCFGRELTGWMHERSAYLNVSDGGHVENLGIYELLRRRCKFIIAIDGEADPARSFGGLLTLTQYANTDLGVQIEPDLADLQPNPDGFGRAHFTLADIHYPDDGRGLLLYLKSSLTGNESEFLKRYRRENPDFPHQSTAQQLFGEAQFEAYRALGEHIAEDLFRSDLVGDDLPTRPAMRIWFDRLAGSLLA